MTTDKRGIILNIGDTVAFTLITYRGNSSLQSGEIIDFEKGCVKIKVTDGGIVKKRGYSIVKCAEE